jgi:putative transposase
MAPGRFTVSRNRRLSPEAYCEAGRCCFVTVRSYQRQRPFTCGDLNDAIVDVLLAERLRSGCDLYVYCLMPDHLHLIASPRDDGRSVLTYVDRFKALSTRVSWRFRLSGKLWQPRSYDHVLRRGEDVERVSEYIWSNPVRAGLVEDAHDYRWCDFVDLVS